MIYGYHQRVPTTLRLHVVLSLEGIPCRVECAKDRVRHHPLFYCRRGTQLMTTRVFEEG